MARPITPSEANWAWRPQAQRHRVSPLSDEIFSYGSCRTMMNRLAPLILTGHVWQDKDPNVGKLAAALVGAGWDMEG